MTTPPRTPTCCELACYEDPGCTCDGCHPDPAPLDVKRERLVVAALRYYADTMPGYAAAAGLSREEFAAVMVDVNLAREYAKADR